MKKVTVFLLTSMLMCSTQILAQSSNNQDDVVKIEKHNHNAFREGELIVKFKPESRVKMRTTKTGMFSTSSVNAVDAVMKKLGVISAEQLMPLSGRQVSRRKMKSYSGKVVEDKDLSQLYCLKLDSKEIQSVYQAVEVVQEIEEVEYAEPNYLVYTLSDSNPKQSPVVASGLPAWGTINDPLFSQLWGIKAINLDKLWSKPTLTDKRSVIAILDTGVDTEHPDLSANIWTNTRENDGEEKVDDDNNGFKDDIHGWDFVNQTGKIRDNNGHGTHCAGIAAAVGGNSIGIIGGNPDAYIMPVTVMQSDGTGDVATIIKGIDYATANGADVISMSFGRYGTSLAEEQALSKAYAKAVLVAAAGNDCLPIDPSKRCPYCNEFGAPLFPAAYTFVLGVEAASISGDRASFSNYDNDGPTFSTFDEEKLYNYELRAPGTNILSTFIGGQYKELNGTSMACPLVAGAVSRLLTTKEYDSKELLFGDLIHTSNNVIDILAVFNIEDSDRKPSLELVTYTIDDSKAISDKNDGDGRIDAGETIDIYPIIRNSWGQARNIKCSISLAETEDPEIVSVLNTNVEFGYELSAYSKNTSVNPLRFKVSDDCADGRHICMVIGATCTNNSKDVVKDVVFIAENGVEIGGIITEDLTLHPNVHYIVTSNLAVPAGVQLTIEPGTILRFKDGVSMSAHSTSLNCNGAINNFITFTKAEGENGIYSLYINGATISRTIIENNGFFRSTKPFLEHVTLKDCIIRNCNPRYLSRASVLQRCNVLDNYTETLVPDMSEEPTAVLSNFLGNITNNIYSGYGLEPWHSQLIIESCNAFPIDVVSSYGVHENYLTLYSNVTSPYEFSTKKPSFFGTSNVDLVRQTVFDIENNSGFGYFDLSNMLTHPVAEAHGIVWKVVVDGYDAQDEFDKLPPLGVGRHKFEIYFNRPMDKSVAPNISMGVRSPYTQVAIAENGAWNEAGDVYTAYLTITSKTSSDGLNRIYVYGAKDDEFFEIPEEYSRFNVNVQAAGSMSTGFMGEAGLGKVTLSWADAENSFDDFLGYNLYRFCEPREEHYLSDWEYDEEKDEWGYWDRIRLVSDTIRVNEQLLDNETLNFEDYTVTPGTTYYYFYKVLTTDLKETDKSNVVSVTPRTSALGDANGSGDVDVADVITTVNYAAGQQPKPFIFEAADMNKDKNIDILDVVGIIKTIINPKSEVKSMVEASADYSVEDGIVYVETPVALAGVQIRLLCKERSDIEVAEDMRGFENVSAWLSDNDYIFLGYNMNGITLTPGKHAILKIGDAQLGDIRLSDSNGHNVQAVGHEVTKIDYLTTSMKKVNGIYTVTGVRISGNVDDLENLPKGVYIVNGEKIMK